MVGVEEIFRTSIIISLVCTILTVIGLCLYWIGDLYSRIKSDVPYRRRAWILLTVSPKHIYHQTNWNAFVFLLGLVYSGTMIASIVIAVFTVGLMEVLF